MNKILLELPGLISSTFAILGYIQKVRAAAQQSSEWTPEMEQQYQGLLDAAKDAPAWQPDPESPS